MEKVKSNKELWDRMVWIEEKFMGGTEMFIDPVEIYDTFKELVESLREMTELATVAMAVNPPSNDRNGDIAGMIQKARAALAKVE